jgi:hypothetical protein
VSRPLWLVPRDKRMSGWQFSTSRHRSLLSR